VTAILRPTEPDGRGRAELALVSPMRCAEETDAARRVLESGALAQADEVAAFEQEFSDALVLDRPCVAVNSGTSGLHLGLLAAGIGPGDEVIVPSFTFAATANAVALTGARPVFADIEPDTFCLSPDATAAAITARTAAIMPVHLFGHPADLPRLSALAARHGLALFEDAAQAHGASMNGVPVGSVGRFAMFSFYATKNMTSGGEGGMVSCADRELERSLRLLRNQGMLQRYRNEVVGLNCRMSELHAALGRVQLARLREWNDRRRHNAERLTAGLPAAITPVVRPGAVHVYHQYTIRVPERRDEVATELREQFGIGSGTFYPTPVHELPSFGLGLDLPETRRAAAEVLSLPVGPHVTDADADRIVHAVNSLV
jgi:perosamine synthetase